MIPLDQGITGGAVILFLTLLPTLFNRAAQVPRWKSSVPITAVLYFYAFLFAYYGLYLSMATVALQASAWLGISIFRPVKKASFDAE